MRRITVLSCLSIGALLVASLGLAACDVSINRTEKKTTPAATTSATTTPTTDTGGSATFAVGDSIAAIWSDGNLYLATVTAVDGETVTVTYADDGSSKTVAASECRPIPDATFAVGDRVLAVWSDGRFYPGEITAVDGTLYTVAWDDGSQPSQVDAGMIIAE